MRAIASGSPWTWTSRPGERRCSECRSTENRSLDTPFQVISIPYESDGLHMYWAFTDLIRIDLATSEQQVVATEVATAHKASHIAFTRDWIFVSTRASPGGIIRLPKPAP